MASLARRAMRGSLIAAGAIAAVLAVVVAALLVRTGLVEVEDRSAASPRGGAFVAAYDTRLFVQRAGEPGAPAVVFIHGTGAWSEMWRPYMAQVARSGYQAIALDVPPFGYSEPPRSGNYDKAEQAKRILGALDSLGVHRAIFVVHSIGSAPVMEALLAHPERADRLVLVAPALGLDTPRSDGGDSLPLRLLEQHWFSETLTATLFTNRLLTERLVRAFVSEKEKVTPQWVELYQRPFSLSGYHRQVALWLPELVKPRTTHVSENPEAYRGIHFPTFLIWGTADAITPLRQGRHLAALIPGATLMLLPGGHVPMIEEPEKFSAFLAEAIPSLGRMAPTMAAGGAQEREGIGRLR